MAGLIDETHDPALRSWVESANEWECEFPIQNLPVGVYRRRGENNSLPGLAIGEFILDLSPWLPGKDLSEYFRLHSAQRHALRRAWSDCLRAGASQRGLIPQSECEMCLPVCIGDYTDFYASIHHAANVGKMFRPDAPLLPNYKHLPIAYHGRASSIVVSGTAVRRPCGQLGEGQFGLSQELDYEIEVGAFLGPGNAPGQPIPIGQAEDHLIGLCLLNDWSARDIQRWEYQPLGPFLAKNFATSISPWIVTAEALEPFRTSPPPHDGPLLSYLHPSKSAAFDITVEVWLRTANMSDPVRISRGFFRDMYWTVSQMIAHHTSNGCQLRAGDLLGSGTISGPERGNRGCLLELTWKGQEPLQLPNGEERRFLEDGDEIILRGYCEREGFRRIGFGSCSGIIAPSEKEHLTLT